MRVLPQVLRAAARQSALARFAARRAALQQARWASEPAKAAKKKWEDMDEKDLEDYQKSLTWWPYIFFGLLMAFIWTPEHTKFVWHLQLQCWVHEMWWKWNLPKEQADRLIREARIGVPSGERTSGGDPLAACPVLDNGEDATVEDLGRAAVQNRLPPGHPGSLPQPAMNPFTASVVQVTEDLKAAKAQKEE